MVRAQHITRNPVLWFVVGALVLVTIGFWASAFLGMSDSALDIAIHDSYLVVAHWHLVLITGLFCVGCAAVYWVCARVFKRPLNSTLGSIHAALSFIGLLGVFFPMHLIGSMPPRRYNEYDEFNVLEGAGGTADLNAVVTLFTLVFLAGQSIFLYNLIRTLLRNKTA